LSCLVVVSANNDAAATNSAGTNSANSTEIREGIRAALKKWEQAHSGRPINCRRLADLFEDDGYWISPAGSGVEKSVQGQIFIYRTCDTQRYFSSFELGKSRVIMSFLIPILRTTNSFLFCKCQQWKGSLQEM
jgi:hypothetical protein